MFEFSYFVPWIVERDAREFAEHHIENRAKRVSQPVRSVSSADTQA
jgi:hypothetical protein